LFDERVEFFEFIHKKCSSESVKHFRRVFIKHPKYPTILLQIGNTKNI